MPGRWGTSQWMRTPMVSILAVYYNDEILTPARPQHYTAGGKPRNRNPLRNAGSASPYNPCNRGIITRRWRQGKRFESARRLSLIGVSTPIRRRELLRSGVARGGMDTCSGVDCLVLTQHRHVFLDASCPRLGFLGVLDPVQDRIPVPAVERGEELSG